MSRRWAGRGRARRPGDSPHCCRSVARDALVGSLRSDLRETIERAAAPPRDLLFTQLAGDPECVPQIFLAFVQASEIAVADPALRERVRHLPAGAELLEDL